MISISTIVCIYCIPITLRLSTYLPRPNENEEGIIDRVRWEFEIGTRTALPSFFPVPGSARAATDAANARNWAILMNVFREVRILLSVLLSSTFRCSFVCSAFFNLQLCFNLRTSVCLVLFGKLEKRGRGNKRKLYHVEAGWSIFEPPTNKSYLLFLLDRTMIACNQPYFHTS